MAGSTFEIPKSLAVGLISLEGKDLSFISQALRRLGLQNITQLGSIEAAVQFTKGKRKSLLILDVRSQIEMGVEHIKDLKIDQDLSNFPLIPVVKSGERALVLSALRDYGVVEAVTLPLQPANLLQAIGKVLSGFLPGEFESEIEKARCSLAEGNIDSAEMILRELSATRQSIRTELGLSHISHQRKDVDKAKRYLNRAEKCDPSSFGVKLGGLRNMLLEKVDPATIEDFVGAMLQSIPPTTRVSQILMAFYAASRFSEGLHISLAFDRYLSIDPMHKIWQTRLALKCHRVDSALQFIQAFHRSGQRTQDSLNMLGVVYKKKRNYEQAIEAFEEAMAVNPSDFRIPYNLGLLYEQMNLLEQAYLHYKMAVEVYPGHKRAQDKLKLLGARLAVA